jgi:quercetin dioxygenase-like cupin family protein
MTQTAAVRPQGPPGICHDVPTLIRAAAAPRFLWGDRKAGFVSDWIYGSSPRIHMMSFELPPGARFGNSPDFKTFYGCQETYTCLSGEFTFHCPETGEIHVLKEGDTLWFPPDTWHWGYNFGAEPCHVLECLTPRTAEAVELHALAQPWLEDIRMGPRERIHDWRPGEPKGPLRARLCRPGEHLHEILGEANPLRIALACTTEMLTVGVAELHPGLEGDLLSHPGDKVLYCLAGRANLYIPDASPNWWEMNPGDTGFLPGGVAHAFFNTSDAMARVQFGVAPLYR